jgi:hypothetical protein
MLTTRMPSYNEHWDNAADFLMSLRDYNIRNAKHGYWVLDFQGKMLGYFTYTTKGCIVDEVDAFFLP